jgi:hypothetical protein
MKKTKPTNHSKLIQEAKESILLSESILDMLIDLVFVPYIHMQAKELKNSKEWKETEAKMKELNVKSEKLQKKIAQLRKQHEKEFGELNAKEFGKYAKNIKSKKATKPL